VYPKASELERTIDKLCFHIEEPFRSLSVYSQFCLYNTISSDSKVKVVLNGQGADELFGGYTSHYYYLFASLLKRFRLLKLIFEIYLLKHQRNAKYSTIFRTLMGRFLESLRIPNYFNAMTFTEISKSALREYLTYEDRNSMSFGIESRLPFMDYRLVEFAFSLDEEYKIDNFVNKRIVREYAKGSVADSIIQRKDKTGFISPQELWQKGVLADSFNTVFAGIKKRGVFDFLDTDKLSRSYVEYKNGTLTEWSFIWRIYCLEKWKISTGGSNHE
jgi:asparagine synthase (glutamine-hydrolysing)